MIFNDYLILQSAYLSQQRCVQWRGWCAAGDGGRSWREEDKKKEVGGDVMRDHMTQSSSDLRTIHCVKTQALFRHSLLTQQ